MPAMHSLCGMLELCQITASNSHVPKRWRRVEPAQTDTQTDRHRKRHADHIISLEPRQGTLHTMCLYELPTHVYTYVHTYVCTYTRTCSTINDVLDSSVLSGLHTDHEFHSATIKYTLVACCVRTSVTHMNTHVPLGFDGSFSLLRDDHNDPGDKGIIPSV